MENSIFWLIRWKTLLLLLLSLFFIPFCLAGLSIDPPYSCSQPPNVQPSAQISIQYFVLPPKFYHAKIYFWNSSHGYTSNFFQRDRRKCLGKCSEKRTVWQTEMWCSVLIFPKSGKSSRPQFMILIPQSISIFLASWALRARIYCILLCHWNAYAVNTLYIVQ